MRLATPSLTLATLLLAAGPSLAVQGEPAAQPAAQPAQPALAATRIEAVTVYERTALVTRIVEVPAQQGVMELTVGPLPTSLQPESLYAESAEGVRVLTTRYRQRVERSAIDEEVRQLEEQLAALRLELAKAQASRAAVESDMGFLTQLEGFTANTAKTSAGEAKLDAEAFIKLAEHITTQRRALAQQKVDIEKQAADLQQQISFTEHQLAQVRAKADRVSREAVLVLDNQAGGATTVRLSYLVSAAGWRPHYKLRAGRNGSPAILEYLAAIQQQSGEDWTDVELTLSTATPRLNAAPPLLSPLAVVLSEDPNVTTRFAGGGGKLAYEQALRDRADADKRYQAQTALAMPGQQQQGQTMDALVLRIEASKEFNEAAAKLVEAELMVGEKLGRELGQAEAYTEGQSVTFALQGPVSVPWRDDEQQLEIARIEMQPEYVYKAVPVLTPHVYRLASMTNSSEHVILPGPAMMYLDGDFVGRGDLALVASGERFTAGLGVDPQIRAERVLLDRATSVQGGNQILTLKYAIRIKSFKDQEARLQVWDRLPQDQPGALSVDLVDPSHPLSEDADFLQEEKPRGLLRWDVAIAAGQELEIRFAYTIAFDRKYQIGGLQAE